MQSIQSSIDPEIRESPVLLFDGVCNFCNASVRFVIKRDPKKRFRFASLQSEAGQRFLQKFGMDQQNFETVVLVEGERVLTKSTAALRVVWYLKGAWPILSIFLIIPRFLRDWIYGLIAKRRYRFFGKKEFCELPSLEDQDRFLS